MSTCLPSYSRQSPSPRYRELLALYSRMHVEGDRQRNTPPEQLYPGDSMPRHARPIKELIDRHGAKSILDYGAGKGMQYKNVRIQVEGGGWFPSIPAYWGVTSVTCYDPAYEPFRRLPLGPFDGVVSTDVLEHCPEDDVEWIVTEMFGYARKFVYANVACYPAIKHLPTGENAHCTIRSTEWWDTLVRGIAAKFPAVRFQFAFDHLRPQPDGSTKLIIDTVTG